MIGETAYSPSAGPFTQQAFIGPLMDPELEIPPGVTDSQGRAATKRFDVYRNNVIVSLMDCLAAAYPSIREVMGEENFAKVSRHHIYRHPPKSPVMIAFGDEFPEYLDSLPALRKSPFLGDLGRLERAWLQAYHAADAVPLESSLLAEIAPEDTVRLVFETHPAARIVASDFPIAELFEWRHSRPQRDVDLSVAQNVIVSRPYLEVKLTTVDRGTAGFFEALASAVPLGQAAAAASEAAEADFDLSRAMALALELGIFAHAHLE